MNTCATCGTQEHVRLRKKSEASLCDRCWRNANYTIPKHKCSVCGKVKRIAKNIDSGPICHACYKRTIHREQCSVCGEIKTIALRHEDGSVVCKACHNKNYQPPLRICSLCGEKRPWSKKVAIGGICSKCLQNINRRHYIEICVRCGKERERKLRLPDGGAVCNNCSQRERRQQKEEK